MSDKIGKRTAKLLGILEDRSLTGEHFHIIAHPQLNERAVDSQHELDKLRCRGLVSIDASDGTQRYSLSPKGLSMLNYYRT